MTRKTFEIFLVFASVIALVKCGGDIFDACTDDLVSIVLSMKDECRENMEKILKEAKKNFESINEANFSSEKATVFMIDFLVESSINFLNLELLKHSEDIANDFNLNSKVVVKIMEGKLKDFSQLRSYECLAEYLEKFTEIYDEISNEIVFLAASIKSEKLREIKGLRMIESKE